MPFFQKGDLRIRYEEAGSGFPLGSQVRTRLAAGGRWIRTSGSGVSGSVQVRGRPGCGRGGPYLTCSATRPCRSGRTRAKVGGRRPP